MEQVNPTVEWLAAKLETTKAAMLADLNRDLFRDGVAPHVARVTWYARVRRYLSTLWLALKGQDPYDGDW